MGVLEEDAAIWVEGKTERREGMTAGADLAVHSYRPRNTPQLGTRSGRRGDVDDTRRQSIKGDVAIIVQRSSPKMDCCGSFAAVHGPKSELLHCVTEMHGRNTLRMATLRPYRMVDGQTVSFDL